MRTDENSYLTDESEMMIIVWACCPEIRMGTPCITSVQRSPRIHFPLLVGAPTWSVVVVKYKKFQPYINILTHHSILQRLPEVNPENTIERSDRSASSIPSVHSSLRTVFKLLAFPARIDLLVCEIFTHAL